jgi:hypothetical protein
VGFGVATPAGRGGAILRVSTLADDGEGSLRAALSTPGVEPRVIVFEVSGTIVLSDNLVVEHPFVTIAGQTAPSPGITLRGAALQIATHDVLVQHLRIRVGDDPEGPRPALRDGLLLFGDDGRDVHNVVVDHVSVSWAIDENASTSTSGLRRDITIVNSIVSEGLSLSLHTEGEHSKGLLVGEDSRNIAVLRNLFAHNYRRNPEIKGRTTSIVANNLIYNSGLVAIEFNSGAMQSSIVGNVMILGPSTGDNDLVAVDLSVEPGSAIYLADNVAPEVLDIHEDLTFDPIVDQPPMSLPGLTILPSADVEEHVLVNAGARPADRDAVDLRIVAEVRARNGRIINSPAEVGGWPVLAENRHTLVIPQNPGGDDDADGYTNLEEWLHGLAAQVEGR